MHKDLADFVTEENLLLILPFLLFVNGFSAICVTRNHLLFWCGVFFAPLLLIFETTRSYEYLIGVVVGLRLVYEAFKYVRPHEKIFLVLLGTETSTWVHTALRVKNIVYHGTGSNGQSGLRNNQPHDKDWLYQHWKSQGLEVRESSISITSKEHAEILARNDEIAVNQLSFLCQDHTALLLQKITATPLLSFIWSFTFRAKHLGMFVLILFVTHLFTEVPIVLNVIFAINMIILVDYFYLLNSKIKVWVSRP